MQPERAPRNQRSPRDPARTVRLLWSAPGVPGRSGLTLGGIVTAAIALADEEGIESVSMRRVAERVGTAAMSLYTHVPGRTELLELMIDAVHAGLYPHPDAAREAGGWRDGLRLVARRNWELFRTHTWLLDVLLPRPVLGPHTIGKYEAELRPLEGAGLTDVEMDSVLTLVLSHVATTARTLAGIERTTRQTGMTDDEWWRRAGPALTAAIDPAEVPVAARVGAAAGEAHGAGDPLHLLDFGLDRILDGVDALIASRGAVSGRGVAG